MSVKCCLLLFLFVDVCSCLLCVLLVCVLIGFVVVRCVFLGVCANLAFDVV